MGERRGRQDVENTKWGISQEPGGVFSFLKRVRVQVGGGFLAAKLEENRSGTSRDIARFVILLFNPRRTVPACRQDERYVEG